jgi:hypothetical protein
MLLVTIAVVPQPDRSEYFKITVIDGATGRGVPLVELRTTNEISSYTDSNGIIAWNEPGLMDCPVYFEIRSDGYRFPGRATTLKTVRGGRVVLKMERVNIAERLYRITGQGIYRDSILTGDPVPLRNPALNGEVMGQDTVMVAPYRGKLYWFWGDTNRASAMLGSFASTSATSEFPGKGGLDPSAGVDLNYFVEGSGFSKPICSIPGPGLKWIYWVLTLADERGRECLVARYRSMKSLDVILESGLAIFNDEKEVLEPFVRFDADFDPVIPMHPFRVSCDGTQFFYFAGALPLLRVPAELKQIANPSAYEGFTCLAEGSRYVKGRSRVDRGPGGRPTYSWKKNTPSLSFEQQKELISAGQMKPDEGLYQLRDVLIDTVIKPHASSVFWNDFRRRWVMIVEEDRGLTDNGEIWYAEGDTPAGPWVYAAKVVTHNKYTFYNPAQHPFFDQEGGRLIYFEGTYTDFFSGSPVKTPRYNYNQIMYRLALDDPRLFLPVPVYRLKNGTYALREQVAGAGAWKDVVEVPFFALPADRPREGSILVDNLFYALPASGRSDLLSGTWSCKAAGSDLILALQQHGDSVNGEFDGKVIKDATFGNGKLSFDAEVEGEFYHIAVEARDGKLSGEWKGKQDGGTITCARDPADWAKSSAIVPLYAYRRNDDSRLYSTAPDLKDRMLKRSASPVCLVWRNPMRVLALDRNAIAQKQ